MGIFTPYKSSLDHGVFPIQLANMARLPVSATGATGGIVLAVFSIVECVSYVAKSPCRDNYQNYVSSLCSLLNSAAVTLVTLPTLIPPDLLPDWVEGPVVMMLLTTATGLQLALSLLDPIKDFLVSMYGACGKFALLLDRTGVTNFCGPVTAVLIALKGALVQRFQKIFLGRAKKRAANTISDAEDPALNLVNLFCALPLLLLSYQAHSPCSSRKS